MIRAMENTQWRDRLRSAIEQSEWSNRGLSLAIGRASGYVRGILIEGKEPTLEAFVALCEKLNVSPTEVLFGVKDGDAETLRLFRAYARMSPDQRTKFLDLAQVISGSPGDKS